MIGPPQALEVRTTGPPRFLSTKSKDKIEADNKKIHSNMTDGKRHKIVMGIYGTRLYPYSDINSTSDSGTLIALSMRNNSSGMTNV